MGDARADYTVTLPFRTRPEAQAFAAELPRRFFERPRSGGVMIAETEMVLDVAKGTVKHVLRVQLVCETHAELAEALVELNELLQFAMATEEQREEKGLAEQREKGALLPPGSMSADQPITVATVGFDVKYAHEPGGGGLVLAVPGIDIPETPAPPAEEPPPYETDWCDPAESID